MTSILYVPVCTCPCVPTHMNAQMNMNTLIIITTIMSWTDLCRLCWRTAQLCVKDFSILRFESIKEVMATVSHEYWVTLVSSANWAEFCVSYGCSRASHQESHELCCAYHDVTHSSKEMLQPTTLISDCISITQGAWECSRTKGLLPMARANQRRRNGENGRTPFLCGPW